MYAVQYLGKCVPGMEGIKAGELRAEGSVREHIPIHEHSKQDDADKDERGTKRMPAAFTGPV